jgi:hypothetical protein
MMRRRARWIGPRRWFGAALFALGALHASAENAVATTEQQVKAAYILNFTRYAIWPGSALADAPAPLVLCLIGAGAVEIGRLLQSRLAGSRPLSLRPLARSDDSGACHALFIGAAEHGHQAALLARLRERPILTIGESDSFLADGGMIKLMLVDGTVRFEVNLAVTRQSGLGLHPRVLALAERIVGGGAK